jgi:hypothetical protein
VPFGRRELGIKTQRTVGLAPADNSRHHPAVVVGSRLALNGPGPRDRRRGDPVADETDRRLCLVEHDLLGLSSWQLASVHRALGEAVRREIWRGSRIRYVQRIYVPEEQWCLCLFEAADPETSGRSMTSRTSRWPASSPCSARYRTKQSDGWPGERQR